jgi:V/A-type H+-transporting ATPase subunit I
MLKPAEMRELRIVALEKDIDGIVKQLDALGTVHITDIKEFLDEWEGLIEPSKAEETVMKAAELLTRVANLRALLTPATEGDEGSAKQPAERPRKEATIAVDEINLEQLEAEFSGLEETVTALVDANERLREELSHPKSLLRILKVLEEFGIDLDFVGDKDFTSVYVGKMPSKNVDELRATLDAAIGESHVIVSRDITEAEEATGPSNAFAVVVSLKRDKTEVERALRLVDFEPYLLPLRELPARVKDAIAGTEARISKLEAEIMDNERELDELRRTRLQDLLMMQELVQIEESKARVKILFGTSERVRVIEGWTPEEEVNTVIEAINGEVGGLCVIEVREPKRSDVRVPSLLKNSRLVKPFESIIRMYSLPSYRDIDPTLITAIMFPVLFGLMFPDIGHGLLLLLSGLALFFGVKGLKGFEDWGWIIALCGVCAIGGGILFGEFFGFSEYAAHLLRSSMEMEVPHLLHTIFIHEPLWFEPIPNVTGMFVITLLIGAVHMGLGVVLGVTNKVSDKDTLGTVIGIVKVWTLIGALFFLLILLSPSVADAEIGLVVSVTQVIGSINLMQGFVVLVALPILLLFSLSFIHELKHERAHGKPSFIDLFIMTITGIIDAVLENFFRFLANTVSYGRILALALAHAALIEVFILLTFMSSEVNIGLAAVVFLAGTAIVVLLEGLMSGIHAIRLHYYEWFTKFYEGGGVEFSPFKFRRTFTR